MKKLLPKPFISVSLLLAVLVPACAFAFDLATSSFKDVICYGISLLQIIDPILFFLAFILFFWGLSKFIINSSGNDKEIQVGKSYMLWGILALFVLMTFQTMVGLITDEFGFGKGITSGYPFLPSSSGGSVCQNSSAPVESVTTKISF